MQGQRNQDSQGLEKRVLEIVTPTHVTQTRSSLQLLAARSGICLLPFSYGIFPFALGARVHIFVVIEMHCLGTGGPVWTHCL